MKKLYIRPEVEIMMLVQADMLCISGQIDNENGANMPGYAREFEAEEW